MPKKAKSDLAAEELRMRQKKFCDLFVNGERELFGNGVQCYLAVYEIDRSKPNWYKTACVCASQLLSNPKVMARINELLEMGGFNDANVEKQHTFLINQFSDFGVKERAITVYYKLKGKFAPDEVRLTGTVIAGFKFVKNEDSHPDHSDNSTPAKTGKGVGVSP